MARMGEIIDGKYEVLREVGRGGMSVVYLAMDKRLNKQWAIKEFRKDKDDASKQVALKALLDEANLMKKLDHPTLPRIVDIIDDHQNVYVIMDYIEGESLNKVLDAYGAQPQEAVIEWAKQLSEVLDYLHTQTPPVIYRDMKPANIMLKPDGTVRLIDFGIAREYKEGKAGDTEAIGTRGYAAPEQFGGKGQTDARTDIYSLGVTLYHLVTGKNPAEPPYELYPIRHWDPNFSSGLEWLIQKCTQLNPGDRYQSCAEVSYVLDNLDKFDTEYKRKKKNRFTLFITSLILTIVFTVGSIGLFVGSDSAKKNSYASLIEEGRYIEAIETDDERTEAYVELAKHLTDTLPVVKSGSLRGETTVGTTITDGDLSSWFSTTRMDALKEKSPEDYARIQFELGLLMWESFEPAEGTQQDMEILDKAIPHFEKVIRVAKDENLEHAGLTPKEYEFARMLYCVTYFQQNRNRFSEAGNDIGRTQGIDELQEFAGIDADVFSTTPYLAYWNTMMQTLDFMSENPAIAEQSFKLKLLNRLAAVLESTYGRFKEQGVTFEQMGEFRESFLSVWSGIESNANTQEGMTQTKGTFNKAIAAVNAAYGTEPELEGIG